MNVGLEIFVDYDQAEVKSFEIYENLLARHAKFRPHYDWVINFVDLVYESLKQP